MTTFDNSDRPELDWLAFRYVAGEMTDAETLAWEERLATDQTAREAVAAAVELYQAVSQLPHDAWSESQSQPVATVTSDSFDSPAIAASLMAPQHATQRPTRSAADAPRFASSRMWLGLSVTAAAVVLLVVVVQAVRSQRELARANAEVSDDLVAAWSLVRTSPATETAAEASAETADSASEDWPAVSDADVDRELDNAPSWLVVGMAGLVAEHADEEASSTPSGSREL